MTEEKKWLRNPNLKVNQIAYPDNIYDIGVRTVTPLINTGLANVEIFLDVYPDPEKSFQFEHKPIYYILRGLPDDDKQLVKSLYRAELQKQKGDKILDGTALKDFVIVDQ